MLSLRLLLNDTMPVLLTSSPLPLRAPAPEWNGTGGRPVSADGRDGPPGGHGIVVGSARRVHTGAVPWKPRGKRTGSGKVRRLPDDRQGAACFDGSPCVYSQGIKRSLVLVLVLVLFLRLSSHDALAHDGHRRPPGRPRPRRVERARRHQRRQLPRQQPAQHLAGRPVRHQPVQAVAPLLPGRPLPDGIRQLCNRLLSLGAIGDTERDEVAWCTKPGHGTRLIPDGTLSSVHFVKTPSYVQVTGTGDLTKMNIIAGDEGGELDPHGADGNGNPIGGLVYTNAYNNQTVQIHQWTNFMSADQFCFKACLDAGDAETQCNHIYDRLGCDWNMPANYGPGFESCAGDVAEYPGVHGYSTYYQDDALDNVPDPHPAPASSNCVPQPSPSNGVVVMSTTTTTSTSTPTAAPSGMTTSTTRPSGGSASNSSGGNQPGGGGATGAARPPLSGPSTFLLALLSASVAGWSAVAGLALLA